MNHGINVRLFVPQAQYMFLYQSTLDLLTSKGNSQSIWFVNYSALEKMDSLDAMEGKIQAQKCVTATKEIVSHFSESMLRIYLNKLFYQVTLSWSGKRRQCKGTDFHSLCL